MKSYHQKFISNHPYESVPMAEISGFPVRPGIYDLNGATPLQNGVNFTIIPAAEPPANCFCSTAHRKSLLLSFHSRMPTRLAMSIP